MPTQLLDYFAHLVAEEQSIPLTEAAIAVAHGAYPDLDVQSVLSEIDILTLKLRAQLQPGVSPLQKLRVLNHFFYRHLRFQSVENHEASPDDLYLHSALQRRSGQALTLGLLYIELGQQIGLPLRGVPFPEHFFVRLTIAAGEVFLDPHSGASLTKENLQILLSPYAEQEDDNGLTPLRLLLQDASAREILAYFLRFLKRIYLQDERWERLLDVQQRLVILLPDAIEEIRDRGLSYANLEYFRLAKADLSAYIHARPYAADIPMLQKRLSYLNQV